MPEQSKTIQPENLAIKGAPTGAVKFQTVRLAKEKQQSLTKVSVRKNPYLSKPQSKKSLHSFLPSNSPTTNTKKLSALNSISFAEQEMKATYKSSKVGKVYTKALLVKQVSKEKLLVANSRNEADKMMVFSGSG